MGDTFEVMDSLTTRDPKTAVIIGAGYIGLEMAEGLTARGITVTQIEALPEVLPTVDPELGALIHAELQGHGVEVLTGTAVTAIARTGTGALTVTATHHDETINRTLDLVLVVVGVRPDTSLAADAGAELGIKGAIVVDEAMRTHLPDVFAAGDCVHTHHRLLGLTWLPLGTTAHKQGRVAGENALRRRRPLRRQPRHPRSSRCSISSPLTPGYANTRRLPPPAAGRPSRPPPAPMTTRPTTRAPRPSTSASPATTPPEHCSARNSSDTAPLRSRNASTPTPPPSFPR